MGEKLIRLERRRIPIKTVTTDQVYEIVTCSRLIRSAGKWARDVLGESARKVLVVSNRKVFGLYGEDFLAALQDGGFVVEVWLMPDGERFKNMRSLDRLLRKLGEHRFTRTDAIAALGGGVVGDLAGFAASVYLRGIRFLQVPTTLLSMIDSSVGGKTGVNTEFGKNLIGAFHQPSGVLIDVATLRTLERRELVAGFCEAIKHGAIAGRDLLEQTGALLRSYPVAKFQSHFGDQKFESALTHLVGDQVAFKASVVSGDPFEDVSRSDHRSRKILNFGHTLAHALERVTDYRHFKHGEAVGYGIRFAAELSKSLEFIDANDLQLLNDVVQLLGGLPDVGMIDRTALYDLFGFDKKNIAGELQFVLLKGIGEPAIVPNSEIPEMSIREALAKSLG